jgi:hypothetical protein
MWRDVKHVTQKLNALCTSLGGPEWVNAPTTWTQRDPKRIVAAPNLKCVHCHTHFVKNPGFCQIAKVALDYGGSMHAYRFDKKVPEEVNACKKFGTDMGCNFDCGE